jgi:hypothetical protein
MTATKSDLRGDAGLSLRQRRYPNQGVIIEVEVGHAAGHLFDHRATTDTMGRPLIVGPEQDRAVISGTGGLY